MEADGSGSTIINEGTIDVNHDGSTGMRVTGGATAVNEGTINLNADNGKGIYAAGVGTTMTNTGEINIKDGTSGNKDIVLGAGAKFKNSGSVKSDGTIDFDDMGDGKFVMDEGGTIEAESLEGDFYASGALAMGGYEDEYTTYQMLKTDNIEGDIISNSAMFNAELTEQDDNGYYDIELVRKDFNTIIEDEDLARVLEDSYADDGNEAKEDYYDALKLTATEDELNTNVDKSYGMDIYPSMAKQTFDIINNNNDVIKKNVLENRRTSKIGATTILVGGDYNQMTQEASGNVSGYNTDLYSGYLGAEKQLNKETRVGGIATVTYAKTGYDSSSSSSREDYAFQGNAYMVHENSNNLNFTSTVFAGMTDTTTERNLAFTSISETMTDNLNNYYAGMDNSLSKKYDFGKNYIKPKAELNITYMMQDEIAEGGEYAVNIDNVTGLSVETGLGITLGRDFLFKSGANLNFEASTTAYAELGNPYEELDSSFRTLSDEKITLSGYEQDDFYGEAAVRASYKNTNMLTLYAELGYKIGETNREGEGKIGFNYLV
jgi:hypothetical protein